MRFLILLVLVGLLGVAFFAWNSIDGGQAERAGEVAEAGLSSDTKGAVDVPLVEPEVQEERRLQEAPVIEPIAAEEPEVAEEGREAQVLSFRGNVVIHEVDGSLNEGASGMLMVKATGMDVRATVPIPVEDGAFEARFEVQPDGKLRFRNRTFPEELPELDCMVWGFSGEGSPVLASAETFQITFDRTPLVVTLWRANDLSLTVLDADTGQHLSGVDVFELRAGLFGEHVHPASDQMGKQVAKKAMSPIKIVSKEARSHSSGLPYVVGCQGYAWQKVSLKVTTGGDAVVSLVRGGTLRVLVDMKQVSLGSAFEMRRSSRDQPMVRQTVRGEGPYTFEGLTPGSIELTLIKTSRFDSGKAIGVTVTEIPAGGMQEVLLTVDKKAQAPLVPLAGKLVVGEGWDLDSLTLKREYTRVTGSKKTEYAVRGLSDLKAVEGAPRTFKFDFGDVSEGKHFIGTDVADYYMGVELGPEGDRSVIVEIPRAVSTTVRFINGRTGQTAPIDHLIWFLATNQSERRGRRSSVSLAEGEDRFHLLTPEGSIMFMTFSDLYAGFRESADIRGDSELAFSVFPSARAMVLLKEGLKPVPWPVGAQPPVESLQGAAQPQTQIRGTGLWIKADLGGRYRLEIPKIPGFQPVDAIELDLVEGRLEEVVVQLTRETR